MEKEFLLRTDKSTYIFNPPVKGVDYWTETDQEAIVQQVIIALGTPVFGRVDANKNIILTGELAEGIYKLWYENENGKMTELCTYDTSPGYINWIKRSVEADGVTLYNGGQGWKANTRLNSSGLETTSSAEGVEVSGFIPVKLGDVIYFDNIKCWANGGGTVGSYEYLTFYDSNKTKIAGGNWGYMGSFFDDDISVVSTRVSTSDFNIKVLSTTELVNWSSEHNKWSAAADMAYFRISAEEITDETIITINESID